MEEVARNIYQLDIPLAGSPLREIHTYLICGECRSRTDSGRLER